MTAACRRGTAIDMPLAVPIAVCDGFALLPVTER